MGCDEAGQKQVDYLKQSIIKNKGNRLEPDILSFDRCNMEHLILLRFQDMLLIRLHFLIKADSGYYQATY